jgi:hypothetical protein
LLDEDGVDKAPNRGGKDDPGPRVPCVRQPLTVQGDQATAAPHLLLQRPRWCDQ